MIQNNKKERVWNDPPIPGDPPKNPMIMSITEIKTETDLKLFMERVVTFQRKVMFCVIGLHCIVISVFLIILDALGAGITDLVKFLLAGGVVFIIIGIFLIQLPHNIEKV